MLITNVYTSVMPLPPGSIAGRKSLLIGVGAHVTQRSSICSIVNAPCHDGIARLQIEALRQALVAEDARVEVKLPKLHALRELVERPLFSPARALLRA